MKRIIGFVYLNFNNFKGYPDGIRAKLMNDFFIEIKLIDEKYVLIFSGIRIGRYKTKDPIVVIESKNEEDILRRLETILTNEAVLQRILKDNLNKFEIF